MSSWTRLLPLALLSSVLVGYARAAEDDHDDHDHDEHGHEDPWEWAGAFTLRGGETYTWSAARGPGGAYADPEMKLVVVPLADAATGLEGAHEAAEELWELPEAQWVNVMSGGSLDLTSGGAFNLKFNEATWVTLFHMEPSASGSFAFFAQHFPFEFENGFHYFKDEHGEDLEPFEAEPAESSPPVPVPAAGAGLGVALGAAALTALPGLVMIVVAGPLVARLDSRVFPVVNSFASGAIFSCAVFLLLPEGLHMAGAGQDEVTGAWTWGVAIMLGWLFGVGIHHVADNFKRGDGHSHNQPADGQGEAAEAGQAANGGAPAAKEQENAGVDFAVAGPVLFGDGMHNLVDGMVIGFSAKVCSSAALWSVVAATVAHEAPQELADFVILLTKARINWKWATLANFATALPSTLIGALIAYQADVSANVEGMCLAFGGGAYLFVAVTELGPSLVEVSRPVLLGSLMRIGTFCLGATLIGLVLIGHEHCSAPVAPGVEADPHAGHDHR